MIQTTILIPTYNCEVFLMECIGSIFRQSYQGYEILIIDDGSTDNTQDLISRIDDNRIRYYRNTENRGIVPSLNRGLDLAKGKYIARMDADDIMIGNRLQDQISFLEQNPDYGMVGGNYQVIDETGAYITSVKTSTSSDFIKLGIIFRNQFHHSAVTMRTELARKLKYDEQFRYCEDHELWVRIAEKSKVTNLPNNYLAYRWHKNNSCSQNQATLKTSVLGLLSRELDKLEIEHTSEQLMLHASVCFGTGKVMFADDERLAKLIDWHDVVFSSEKIRAKYSEEWLLAFRKSIMQDYCDIPYTKNSLITFKQDIKETYVIQETEDPGISVIMPTYNQAAYIRASILSLMNQNFKNWELIIINDGCTDNTEDILQPFLAYPNIKYYKNEKNVGLGVCLNKGLKEAKFNFISYLPSDDLYHRKHLQSLLSAIIKDKSIMAIAGVLHNHIETLDSSKAAKSVKQIKKQSPQLVQVLHRKTGDEWIPRKDYVTANLDEMFWEKLKRKGNITFTKDISCEWVSHPYQRHKIIGSFDKGGIYTYKQHYNLKSLLRFRAFGKFIDESRNFKDLTLNKKYENNNGLKILIVGDLSLNPERILALEEAGHILFGLWTPHATGHLNSVGPFPFGSIHEINNRNYVDEIKKISPDIIYGLLNHTSIAFAHQILNDLSEIPFVWHFKESPTYARQNGMWNELIDLFTKSDGQIYISQENKRWYEQFFETESGNYILMDGDLPRQDYFKDDVSDLLSDTEGGFHTVLTGRPYGLTPENIGSLSKHNIHFHFYGDMHQQLWSEWTNRAKLHAPKHFHTYPHCEASDWTKELSKYDAGWLHMTPAENEGEISRVTWNELNLPARIPTLAAAGLPMLHHNDVNHISASYNLLKSMDIGIFFSSFIELRQQLADKKTIDEIRKNVWEQRSYFTFDHHVGRLTTFFKEVIRNKINSSKNLVKIHNLHDVL